MSVLLTYQILTKDKAWVDGRVYKIEKDKQLYSIDQLSAAEKSELQGHIIPDESVIPSAPAYEKGKAHLLMIDLNTKELFYETVVRPLTQEEIQQEQVEKQQSLLDKFDLLLNKQDQIITLLSGDDAVIKG